MNLQLKRQNQNFFEKILILLPENSSYFWPEKNQIYIIKNGQFNGSTMAVSMMKAITPIEFHNRIRIDQKLNH
jgi:hypothetical protein